MRQPYTAVARSVRPGPPCQLMSSSRESSTHLAPARLSATSLSLAHLLLWIGATCLVLGHETSRLQTETDLSQTAVWYYRVRSLAFCPLHGACVAAFLLTLWRRETDGPAFPSQPGHWLLVIF